MDNLFIAKKNFVLSKFSIVDAAHRIGLISNNVFSSKKLFCPFHSGNSASFRIYTQHNNAYCFGCNRYWDPISLISEYNHQKYTEVLDDLFLELGGSLESLYYPVRTSVSAGASDNLFIPGNSASDRLRFIVTHWSEVEDFLFKRYKRND